MEIKAIRRIFMAMFGTAGWLAWCVVIYVSLRHKGRIILDFNLFNELFIEIVLFTIICIFFIVCWILETIDYLRDS